MDASVIIPSYNSLRTIEECLNTVCKQRTGFSYEVIVVDSSDDGTGEVITSRFPEVQLIRMPERTLPGSARNLGIKRAKGKVLVFTDSDCVPEPCWLDKMMRKHEEGGCAGVGGAVLNGLPFNPVAWSGYLLEFSESLPSYSRRFVDLLPTCNVSFHRSVFERYGLFPSDLWPSEDSVFCWRLVCAGERLVFDPEIRVRHIFRSSVGGFLRHQIRLGKASAKARRRGNLTQAWLVDHPVRWLVPVIRLCRVEARLARRSFANFVRFNLLLPLCLSGLIAWGIGFCTPSESGSNENNGS